MRKPAKCAIAAALLLALAACQSGAVEQATPSGGDFPTEGSPPPDGSYPSPEELLPSPDGSYPPPDAVVPEEAPPSPYPSPS